MPKKDYFLVIANEKCEDGECPRDQRVSFNYGCI